MRVLPERCDADAEPDADSGRSYGGRQDALQVRALHADGGGQVRAAGAAVFGDVEHGAVGRGQSQGVEAEPVVADLVPDADLPQHAQGIALHGDAGPGYVPVRLDLRQAHVDTGPAQQDSEAVTRGTAANDKYTARAAHGPLLSRVRVT